MGSFINEENYFIWELEEAIQKRNKICTTFCKKHKTIQAQQTQDCKIKPQQDMKVK